MDGRCGRPNVVDLAAGNGHTCALTGAGAVACWGRDDVGQLGTLVAGERGYAAHADRLPSAIDIATTAEGTCVVATDGRVHCAGANRHGERGTGDRATAGLPNIVGGVSEAVQIDAHTRAVCSRTAAGTVMCWGFGPGLVDNPSATQTLTGATTPISVGRGTLCGVGGGFAGGWCMGSDGEGELGDEGSIGHPECTGFDPLFPAMYGVPCASSPIAIDTLMPVTQVEVGDRFTCLASGAAVSCWGLNTHYQRSKLR